MQKKLLLIVTTLSLMSFEYTMFSASLSVPAVEATGATLLSNDFAEVKRLIDQGLYTSQELNWALVSATCNNNPAIVQLLLDLNQAQDQKILKRSTVDAVRAIAYLCDLIKVRKIFHENKLSGRFTPAVDVMYDEYSSVYEIQLAFMAAAYIGHIEIINVLIDILRQGFKDEPNKINDKEKSEIIAELYLIAKVRNKLALQEVINQFANTILGLKTEELLAELFPSDGLDSLLYDGQLDPLSIQCLEDTEEHDGIVTDIQRLFFHEIFSEEYKRGNSARIEKILNFDRIFKFFVNIGLIDISKASFVTTSQDQDFITFMNNVIKNKLSLKK